MDFRACFSDSFVGFMRDCRLCYWESREFYFILHAMAYAHRAELEFWRRIDIDLVLQSLETYEPSRGDDDPDDIAFLHVRIGDHLFMRQHDERNAVMLSELPPEVRPGDAGETADWIVAELERRGDVESAEYAARDGRKCGQAAMNMLAVAELSATGQPALDPHASDAHEIRARRVAENSRLPQGRI